MARPPQFTDEQFSEALRAVAAESPDYVYPVDPAVPKMAKCVYHRRGGAKGCIIGEALARLGVEQETLAATTEFAQFILPDFGLSDEMGRAAQRAQNWQDEGTPWGKAIQAFNAYLDEPGVDL